MVVSNSKYGNDKRAAGKNRAHLAAIPQEEELGGTFVLDPSKPVAGPVVGMDVSDFEIPRYGEMKYLRLEEYEE